MLDLRGRGALVTGGSGDLGTTICAALTRAGCDVAVGYVGNLDGALRTVKVVEEVGRRACTVRLDQSDPGTVDDAVAHAVRDLGRLDVLVNNAAWNIGIPFAELDMLTVEIWDRIFKTNVRGPFQLARAAAVHMKKAGAGRIVNIASVAGLRPGAHTPRHFYVAVARA
jgi:NAD(P)-dependent dehydrogenase (short-subunit alcohol dehydrogenase family)